MPFIVSRVNTKVSDELKKTIKEGYGKKIELIPGKTEAYVVLTQEDEVCLSAAGKMDIPIAYIEVNIFQNRKHKGYHAFCEAVASMYEELLGIPRANVFINFVDMPGWSMDGIYYDEEN